MSRSSARFHDSHTLYDITKRNTRVLTVSVLPETADDFERIAEAEGRNRSELFREMLRVYRTSEETRTSNGRITLLVFPDRPVGVQDITSVHGTLGWISFGSAPMARSR
jgi:hypothetical protein